MRQHVGLVLLLLTTACAGSEANRAVSTDAPPLHSFTLLYTASLLGQLDPCGCSPDMRGGIGRAATIVERVRAEGSPVLLIDGGDRFFSDDTSTNPIAKEQARLQAQTLAAITRLMKYDAVVLGDRDAAHSNDLADLHLPPLLDPSPQSGDGRDATRILDVGAVRVGLFAAGSTDPLRSGESTDSQDAQDAEDTVESVDVRSISERAGALRAQGAHLVIGIIHRPFGPTRDLAPVAAKAGVDLLFASRSDSPLTDESGADPWSVPPVFTLHPRGEELLRIDISLDIDPAAAAATPALLPVPGVEARQAELAAIEERIHILQRGISSLSPGDPMREARADKVVELQERQSEITSAPPPTLPANSRAFT